MTMRSKQKVLAGVAIFVVVLLVASGVYVYNVFYNDDEEVVVEEPVRVIDDRISPLENQGLVLEVLRMRHRGFLEKLMTPGRSWKQKPSYVKVVECLCKRTKILGRIRVVPRTASIVTFASKKEILLMKVAPWSRRSTNWSTSRSRR